MKKAVFKNAWPYAKDALNLPVKSVEDALPFYETLMGFTVVSRNESPKAIIIVRDNIQIGLAENGGDPSQEGCFFEVDDVEVAFAELKSRGLRKEEADFRIDRHGDTNWKVFLLLLPMASAIASASVSKPS